jgi:hypothetical protein
MAAPTTNRAILIRVRNAAELARSQGALASLAQTLVPATIEAKVYDEMAKKLQDSLKSNNVDAEITIVEPKKFQSATNGHVGHDIIVGAVAVSGVVGLLALIYHFVVGRHHKK